MHGPLNVSFLVRVYLLYTNIVSTRNPEVGDHPLNLRLFIQYNHSYPVSLKAVSPSVNSGRTILLRRVT
jgi:hypothetical protein